MGCVPAVPCGTETIISSVSCCVWPDPAFTITSGVSAVDTSLGTSGIAVDGIIHLYATNALTITTVDNSPQALIEIAIDLTTLSVDQKADFCTLVSECTAAAAGAYTKAETDALLDLKQDLLVFDITPTALSTNPVTSGGVYTYLLDYFNTSTGNSDGITEGAANLFLTVAERAKLTALLTSVWTDTATTTHLVTGTNSVGIGIASALAKTHIKGNANTNATKTLFIENSNNTTALEILDDTSPAVQTDALLVSPAKVTSIKSTKLQEDVWLGITEVITNIVLNPSTNVAIIAAGFQPITITLPLASTAFNTGVGKRITFKRVNSDVSGNAVVIDGNGAELIDNALTVTLLPGDAVTLISDGSQWHGL